jgi:hypothetical protein
VELPLSHLAHGGENILVITVPESGATGPDFILLQAGPGQRLDQVRFSNSGIQVSIGEQEDLADRSDAIGGFLRLDELIAPQ